jgi:hypothetical protein
MWKAVAFIESGREHTRQLDDAFENCDGHAMAAALWTLAEKRPRLKAKLPKYVCPPDTFPEVIALIGKPMADIRKAAAAMRESCGAV